MKINGAAPLHAIGELHQMEGEGHETLLSPMTGWLWRSIQFDYFTTQN